MNRLIIVGNGFDLSLDIKTSYSSFILWYLKRCLSVEHRMDENNLYVFNSNNESVANSSYIKDSKTVEDFLSIIKANKIAYKVKENRIGFLEKIIDGVKNTKWIDIETLYFEFLLQIKESKFDEKVKKGLIVKLNNILKAISENLEIYLMEIASKVEINNNHFESVKPLLFCENLLELNLGNGEFNKSNTLILNFNYTNLTEKWVKEQNNTSQINIHGELNNKENRIIFGYGDNSHHKYLELEQVNDKEYLKNIKSMSYPLTSNYSKLMYFLNTGNINSDSDIKHSTDFEVLIYGHSCGLSDRILLKTIFEHKNCKEIHVAFYNDKNDYFEKTIEISRHFKNKDEFLEKLKPFNKKLKIPQLKKEEY